MISRPWQSLITSLVWVVGPLFGRGGGLLPAAVFSVLGSHRAVFGHSMPDKTTITPAEEEYFHYFAYGSNLLEERLHVQIKGALFKGIGVLHGYTLTFFDYSQRWKGALASIEHSDSNDEVWGCIWLVPTSYLAKLDEQEHSYHRLNVSIKSDHDVLCQTYQYSNPNRQKSFPSPHYKTVIVRGAMEHDLPIKYVNQLKAIEDNGYNGSVALNLTVLREINHQAAKNIENF